MVNMVNGWLMVHSCMVNEGLMVDNIKLINSYEWSMMVYAGFNHD